jgi:hypothetical protein
MGMGLARQRQAPHLLKGTINLGFQLDNLCCITRRYERKSRVVTGSAVQCSDFRPLNVGLRPSKGRRSSFALALQELQLTYPIVSPSAVLLYLIVDGALYCGGLITAEPSGEDAPRRCFWQAFNDVRPFKP